MESYILQYNSETSEPSGRVLSEAELDNNPYTDMTIQFNFCSYEIVLSREYMEYTRMASLRNSICGYRQSTTRIIIEDILKYCFSCKESMYEAILRKDDTPLGYECVAEYGNGCWYIIHKCEPSVYLGRNFNEHEPTFEELKLFNRAHAYPGRDGYISALGIAKILKVLAESKIFRVI